MTSNHSNVNVEIEETKSRKSDNIKFNLFVNTRRSGYGKCLTKDTQTLPILICENLMPDLDKVNALKNDIFTSCFNDQLSTLIHTCNDFILLLLMVVLLVISTLKMNSTV